MPRYNYPALKRRAEAVARMVNDRARKLSAAAGLDPSLLGIHPHNAMCAYRAGHPWPEVNYKLVRRVVWLLAHEFDASECLDRLYQRLGPDAFTFDRDGATC